MSAATDTILEQLKTLSLLEAAELVKQIEEAFGVSAAAPVGVAAAATAAPTEEAVVQTEFNVVLEGLSDDFKNGDFLSVVRQTFKNDVEFGFDFSFGFRSSSSSSSYADGCSSTYAKCIFDLLD